MAGPDALAHGGNAYKSVMGVTVGHKVDAVTNPTVEAIRERAAGSRYSDLGILLRAYDDMQKLATQAGADCEDQYQRAERLETELREQRSEATRYRGLAIAAVSRVPADDNTRKLIQQALAHRTWPADLLGAIWHLAGHGDPDCCPAHRKVLEDYGLYEPPAAATAADGERHPDVRQALTDLLAYAAHTDCSPNTCGNARLYHSAAGYLEDTFGPVATVEPPQPAPVRTFMLVRGTDFSGVSGTGVVADGALFPDGKVALCWRRGAGGITNMIVYDEISHVERVHGHGGATVIEWGAPPCQ